VTLAAFEVDLLRLEDVAEGIDVVDALRDPFLEHFFVQAVDRGAIRADAR